MDHDFELYSDHVLSSQLLSRRDESSAGLYVQDDELNTVGFGQHVRLCISHDSPEKQNQQVIYTRVRVWWFSRSFVARRCGPRGL